MFGGELGARQERGKREGEAWSEELTAYILAGPIAERIWTSQRPFTLEQYLRRGSEWPSSRLS